jgi:N-acetyltransferase
MKLQPIELAGKRARLEPLGYEHIDDLVAASDHDDIWKYLDEATPRGHGPVETLIRQAIDDQAAGHRMPFAVIDATTDRAVGSTSYVDIRPADRGVEIGWTWLAPTVWGTGINTESKYLLLAHAFEAQSAIRVAIKTDARNIRSLRAIERLGAVREGTWRNHRVLSTGKYRDSVYFSIIESEWPLVKARLQETLRT